MECKRPSRLQLLCGSVLAACFALNIAAVHLDGVAVSSDGSIVAGLAPKASVPLSPDSTASRAKREGDLRAAEDYLDSINDDDYALLGNVKDTLERLEDIREMTLSVGAARDARHRLQIRNILRKVREQGEVLKVLAGTLEAEGKVDDGGDILPTKRDNKCSRIRKYHVDLDFLDLVHLFCESLDTVRKAVKSGDDEEPMVYSVSGMLMTMVMSPDYRQWRLVQEIQRLLGEERRWVSKHLAPRPAVTGDALPLPEGTRTRFRAWALRTWKIQIWADSEVDTASLPWRALKEARGVLLYATVEEDLVLSSLRTRIHRIELCKIRLIQFLPSGDPVFREQVREVLHEIKSRLAALHALAARKLAEGEVDSGGELLPSQRDNICAKLDAFGLEEDFHEDARKICETFDRLHTIGKVEFRRDTCVYEVLGRMMGIRRRSGYSDTPVASELETLFAEELSWRRQQDAVVDA